MPAGRPSELTPEVLQEVKRLLPVVLYIETVADYIGVSRISVGNWLRRGRKEYKRLSKSKTARPRKSEATYLEFLITCKKALAEGEFQDAEVIKNASGSQWTAAAWRLERRFPERWSRERALILELVKQAQDNANELAKLRAEVAAPHQRSTEPTEGPAPAATEGTGTTGAGSD